MNPGTSDATTTGTPLPEAPSLADLQHALACLAAHDGAGLSQAELVDHITAMEALKSGLAAAQARLTVRLAETGTDTEAGAGVPAERRGRGLAAEIALAGRSPRPAVPSMWASRRRWSTSSRTPSQR